MKKRNGWKELTHRGSDSPPSVYHLLIIHRGHPTSKRVINCVSICQCNKGAPTRFLTRCPLSWRSLWVNYISSSYFYRLSDSSPGSQC